MNSIIHIDWNTGRLFGSQVQHSEKKLKELAHIFHDQTAFSALPGDDVIYRVDSFKPVTAGTEGGLFWGTTFLQPGKVGDEYFMTAGHFHHVRNRAEYYAVIEGEGALLLMDESGKTHAEAMQKGSINYIPGYMAHRAVNTGNVPLVFVASWPSDAGYDYETIAHDGFGALMVERDGKPTLIERSRA